MAFKWDSQCPALTTLLCVQGRRRDQLGRVGRAGELGNSRIVDSSARNSAYSKLCRQTSLSLPNTVQTNRNGGCPGGGMPIRWRSAGRRHSVRNQTVKIPEKIIGALPRVPNGE